MMDFYIDLGTANTLIYAKRKGFLLNEPSMLTIKQVPTAPPSSPIALGHQAKLMLGKTPPRLTVVRPLRQGVIADFESTTMMLRAFAQRVQRHIAWWRPRLVISLPYKVTHAEREAVREVGHALGARRVHLIDEPMAAALGANLPVMEAVGSMIVDIGAGTTEIAVISCGGIVYANAVRIGGNDMDQEILDYVRHHYHLLIGEQTAERLKIAWGNACGEKMDGLVEIGGQDLTSRMPRKISIPAAEIARATERTVQALVEAVHTGLSRLSPELSADLHTRGITLTGGGALLRNFDRRLALTFRLPVKMAKQPLISVAQGGAKVLENDRLLEMVAG